MTTVLHNQFDGDHAEYHYKLGRLNKTNIVVFIQTNMSILSITNVVEALASRILAEDLQGKHPASVRFFEHYPARLEPVWAWREVTFRDHIQKPDKRDFLTRIVDWVQSSAPAEQWSVDIPRWTTIDKDTLEKLTSLIR